MKALILVGGFGTRLRPLTLTKPKPLVEFGNIPIIYHQLQALSASGVETVVLASSHLSDHIKGIIPTVKESLNMDILFTEEDEPLGTAGPMVLSKDTLDDGKNSPFFVLNSDVICDFPLKEMLKFHMEGGSDATILTTPVEDPSRFGVVVMREKSSRVRCFIEKPTENVGNSINAGIYVLRPSVIDMIPLRPTSIEREIFPKLAEENRLSAFELKGFWADIGEPAGFIRGTELYLRFLQEKGALSGDAPCEITGNVLLSPECIIGRNCKLGPNVVIGHSVIIGNGVRIQNSTIMSGSVVKDNSYIGSSIIGSNCIIGKWARICNTSILGERSRVSDEVHASHTYTLPNASVSANVNIDTLSSDPVVV